jgi:putative nucleotidyltransferase with HDIG domain
VAALVRKAPVVLGKNVTERAGQMIVANLKKLGASATYVPETLKNPLPGDGTQRVLPSPKTVRVTSESNFKTGTWKTRLLKQAAEVNRELWLIFSMFVIVGLMNYLVTSQRMLLGLYTLPTLISAYLYGRRHATFTAFFSVLLVGLVMYCDPTMFNKTEKYEFLEARWYDITAWGGILIVTAYAMGTLYERNAARIRELQQTYKGLMVILRHFISKDDYTENHCYRVSIYAAKIAAYVGFKAQTIEDIRSAALLHDIGKLEISRKLLYKAAKLSQTEYEGMKRHVEKGVDILESVGGPLARIIPIILGHHDKYDGSGYHPQGGEEIPLEARVLSVADVYDSLVSDRPYRKAMSPFEAREIIRNGSGTEFDPRVVNAFLQAFQKGEMEIPSVVL